MTTAKKWTKHDHEREAAKAVSAAFPEVSLHEMRDAPDADLLHRDGFHVGLEIVRTADERVLSLQARLRATSERLQREFEEQSVQGVYRLFYDIQEMRDQVDRRAWDRTVGSNLVELFKRRGAVTVDAAELRAAGVTCIARIESEEAPRTFVGCGWRTTTREGHTLAEIALASKHQKLARYRTSNGDRFEEYWLGIASFGPGTLEDGGFSMLLARRYQTDFDRVLLLNHGPNGRLVGAQDVTPPLTTSGNP